MGEIMTVKINFAKALEMANRAIEEKGEDFVYLRPDGSNFGRCFYVHADKEGKPISGCIVGKILSDNNIATLEYLGANEDPADGVIWRINGDGDYNFTIAAKEFLAELQHLQDSGETWGEARDQAVKYVKDKLLDLNEEETS